jgi:hypothetical protein
MLPKLEYPVTGGWMKISRRHFTDFVLCKRSAPRFRVAVGLTSYSWTVAVHFAGFFFAQVITDQNQNLRR